MILAIIGIVLFLIWAVIYGIFTVAPEMFSEYLDPVFQEEYGMSFEEYMDSMYGEGTFETGDPLE